MESSSKKNQGIKERLSLISLWNPFSLISGVAKMWYRYYVDDARNLLLLDHQLHDTVRQLSRLSTSSSGDPGIPSTLSPACASEAVLIWARFIEIVLTIQETANWHRPWIIRFRFLSSPCHVRAFLLCDVADLAVYEAGLRITSNLGRNDILCRFLNDEHKVQNIEKGTWEYFYQSIHNPERPIRQYAARQYLKLLKRRTASWQRAHRDGITKQLSERTGKLHPKLKSRVRKAITTYAGRTIKVQSQQTAQKRWFPIQKNVASTMGYIKFKRYGRFLITPEQTRNIRKKLQPGDIGLTRRNWYLSNAGIPGFWPHAVIHIGTPSEAQKFFSTPEVLDWVRYQEPDASSFVEFLRLRHPQAWKAWTNVLTKQEARRKGIGIGKLSNNEKVRPAFIEAVRPGVVIRPAEEALSADHTAFMRPKLSRLEIARAIDRAFSNFGKPYDYNFDFATSSQLVCSELVYKSYQPDEEFSGLNFILQETLGRPVLPPNKIAQTYAEQSGQPESCFDFICFLDASEKTRLCTFKSESEFRQSWKRSKWSMMLD